MKRFLRPWLWKFLRPLLWKVLKHDFIPLNPDWTVIHRSGDFGLLGNDAIVARKFLPVSYSFQIGSDWRIRYEVRGANSGLLSFALASRDSSPFCKIEWRVTLPFSFHVERRGDKFFVNDQPLVTEALPSDVGWLYGDFEFTDDYGSKLIRHTSHRVRNDRGTEEGYFNNGAYDNYDNCPSIVPDALLDLLAKHHPPQGRFLDVGCATGLVVEAAQRRGMDAEGVDFSHWAVSKANLRTGGCCRVADMDHSQAADFRAPYDIVVMNSVIEHLAGPEQALRLIFDILRPSGIVYICTLNADSLMHRILQKDWAGYSDYTHRSPWITAHWLEEKARQLGYEVLLLRRWEVWNDNIRDEVWRAFAELLTIHPAATLLEQEYGDLVEIILRRPD